MATSTRNSGVIHSGLYYAPGSLKARHCLEGNRLSFAFCEKYNVTHRRTGKLVVAGDASELAALEALHKRGQENGVEGLRIIGPEEIRRREPNITGVAALDVPSTGIFSSEELVRTFARLAVDQGTHIVTRARVVSLEPSRRASASKCGSAMTQDTHAQTNASPASESLVKPSKPAAWLTRLDLHADEVAAHGGQSFVENLSRTRRIL